jgi:hypothetical protein
VTIKLLEIIGIEDTSNSRVADIKYLKLIFGRLLKQIMAINNKIKTILIGMIKIEIIFLSTNKSIMIN